MENLVTLTWNVLNSNANRIYVLNLRPSLLNLRLICKEGREIFNQSPDHLDLPVQPALALELALQYLYQAVMEVDQALTFTLTLLQEAALE
jgi:hypothetical protein